MIASGLRIIFSQLHETLFADLLQSLQSSNQGHRTLLQLRY
jgi:hypothetical protein